MVTIRVSQLSEHVVLVVYHVTLSVYFSVVSLGNVMFTSSVISSVVLFYKSTKIVLLKNKLLHVMREISSYLTIRIIKTKPNNSVIYKLSHTSLKSWTILLSLGGRANLTLPTSTTNINWSCDASSGITTGFIMVSWWPYWWGSGLAVVRTLLQQSLILVNCYYSNNDITSYRSNYLIITTCEIVTKVTCMIGTSI